MSITSGAITFERFGRSHHMKIRSAEDLAKLRELDETHWVATGAPVGGMSCDPTFLSLVDTDSNDRIMCFELLEAIGWMLGVLSDTSDVGSCSTTLRLAAVNDDCEQGRQVTASISRMLASVGGDNDSDEITLEQIRRVKASVEAAAVSEAGVVLPEAADGQELRAFLTDIIDTVGGVEHPSGQAGVSQEKLDSFLAQVGGRLDWLARAREQADVMPLADRTSEAFALVSSFADKLDQYFAQCEAVALDPRAASYVMASEEDMQNTDLSDPKIIEQFMADAPLAPPNERGVLVFDGQINPYYAMRLARLRNEAIGPALGSAPAEISQAQWREVRSFFAAHEKWLGDQAGRSLSSLDEEALGKYLQPAFAHSAEALIASSRQTAFVLDNIRLTEKLALYQGNLLNLANNFVSFPHLYDPARRAMFEMGSLVMDGRCFNFSVRVDNRAQHAAVAKTGNMFVLYVEVSSPGGAGKYDVAVGVTSGGKGNLCVGKRGVFRDIKGFQCDARVVQIIENPISIFEAVASPFRRFGAMLTGKVEAIASSSQKEFETLTSKALPTASAKAAPPPPQGGRGLMAGGLLMGGGVALAAMGSALAYAADKLGEVPGWKIALTIVVVILVVILPISFVSLLKLRKRDLSAILEGSGWAVNARMRLTLRQGRFFTRRPAYPNDARGVRNPWFWVLLTAVIAAALTTAWLLWGG